MMLLSICLKFSYFHGVYEYLGCEYLEFHEYSQKVDRQFDNEDDLMDYVDNSKKHVTNYEQITQLNKIIIYEGIKKLTLGENNHKLNKEKFIEINNGKRLNIN